MSKRPLTQVSVADDQSSLRSDKLMLPEEMPERLKDIVRKKQSLLAQIWKDQRNMIQYERSYLTACPHGNVLKGYDPAQTESEFEGVSQCKFSLSCTRMRWYVSKSAELNNRVKEDLKAFKEQIQHPQNQQLNGGPAKRQQLPGQQMQDDPLRHTAMNPAMQAPSAYGSQLNAGPGMVPKRMSSLGGFDRSGFDRGGGGWPDPNML